MIQKYKTGLLAVFCLLWSISWAQERKLETYSIETTYEKLKKEYPFISPVEPLNSDRISSNENVIYKNTEERELQVDIYFPKAETDEKFPAVLLIHGGGWLTGSKENERVMAQNLANNGYVAITTSYRLGTEAQYPAGMDDLRDALKWMQENQDQYHIDADRIAVLGASSGAQMATLLGTTSKKVKAIVNVDGIVSFVHPEASEEGWMAATWLGGTKAEKPEIWKEASPLEYVDEQTPPTLFLNSSYARFHAGRDDMLKILRKHNIYHEVHTLEDTPHSFWLMQPWFEETLDHTVNFLNKVLKSSSSVNPKYREISVSKDGTADFSNIQDAINSTRDLGPGEVVINIGNGTYREKVEIPSWKHQLTLVGESKEGVIIVNDDYSGKIDKLTGKKHSTFTSYTLLVEADDIKLKNLTIQNTWCEVGQAVALHVEGDRFIAENCNFLGCQDTLYTGAEGSRQLYKNCYIEGTTDFIFGEAIVVFEQCTIKSLKNSYVTAAATPQNQEFGYVFFDCELIAADGIDEVYLGRPWRPFAKTVFINTKLGSHILPEGWDPWTGDQMFPNKERTTYYAEYQSTGPGAAPSNRVQWSHQLTEKEFEKYTLDNIFKTESDWYWASKK